MGADTSAHPMRPPKPRQRFVLTVRSQPAPPTLPWRALTFLYVPIWTILCDAKRFAATLSADSARTKGSMHNANRLFLSVLLAGFLASAALQHLRIVNAAPAEDAKPAAKIEPWKPEDIIYAETAQQARI